MLDIKVKGQCVEAKLDGEAEQLIQELIMLNIAVINHIVENLKLKPGKSSLMAKLEMIDTVSKCVENGIKMNMGQQLIEKRQTASDLTKDAWGLDMDAVQLELMSMQELINKWLPIMDEHILSNVERTVMQREVEEAELTMEDFINKLIDIKVGNKEVR